MSPWAIGLYSLLVLIYIVPVILFIRRRMKTGRPTPTKGDQSVPGGLVGTLPVDRW